MERYPTTGTHRLGRQLSGEFRSGRITREEVLRDCKLTKILQKLVFPKNSAPEMF